MTVREALRILGLPERTNLREAKAAYRRLAKKYHPDVSSEATAERFVLILRAFECLAEHVRNRRHGGQSHADPVSAADTSESVVRGSISTTTLVKASASPRDTRTKIYEHTFRSFLTAFEQAMTDSWEALHAGADSLRFRILSYIHQFVSSCSNAHQIRSQLRGTVNSVVQGECLSFAQGLTQRQCRIAAEFDAWLTEMRMLAKRHSLPNSLTEYLSRPSGGALTWGGGAALLGISLAVSFLSPFVGFPLLLATPFLSIWGGYGLYRWGSLRSVRTGTISFLQDVQLGQIDERSLPISGELTAEEKAGRGAMAGAVLGYLAFGGPLAVLVGAVLGAGMSSADGKSLEQFRVEASSSAQDAASRAIEGFLATLEHQLRLEQLRLTSLMRANFVANLKDERLVYGL